MTCLWMIVWAISGFLGAGMPHLHQWNAWAVWLLIAVALDLGDTHRSS